MEYKVDFNNNKGKCKRKKAHPITPSTTIPKIPRITKLLALAHHLQDLLDQGVVRDYADIARLSGLSRARVTQIMNLTLLAPKIQEEILLPGNNKLSESEQTLRNVLKKLDWKTQITNWKAMQRST